MVGMQTLKQQNKQKERVSHHAETQTRRIESSISYRLDTEVQEEDTERTHHRDPARSNRGKSPRTERRGSRPSNNARPHTPHSLRTTKHIPKRASQTPKGLHGEEYP